MQNEFEKQVRDKMEELRFVPTQPVWGKIAAQIQKKKQKRSLIWIPIFIALIGGPCLLLWTSGDHENNRAKQTHSQIENTTPANTENPSSSSAATPNQPVQDGEDVSRNSQENIPGSRTADKNVTEATSLPQNHNTETSGVASAPPTSAQASGSMRKAGTRQHANVATDVPANKRNQTVANLTRTTPALFNGDAQPNISFVRPERKQDDVLRRKEPTSVSEALAGMVYSLDITHVEADINGMEPVGRQTLTMPPPPTPTRPGAVSKWSFGVTLSAGISGISSGLGKGPVEKSISASASNIRPPLLPYTYASEVQNSFAYAVGAVVQRRFSPRFNISSGITYLHAGSKTQIGTKNPAAFSLNGALFNPAAVTDIADYYNEYHFLSVPVEASFQLLRKVPFYIHGGGSAARMIATNALEFDPGTQTYTEADSAFNHMQWHTSFGFDYSFGKGKKTFLVGPTVTYGLTRMASDGAAEHLFTFGLRTRFLFKK